MKHLRCDPAARHGARKGAVRQRFTTFPFHTGGYFLLEPLAAAASSSDGKGSAALIYKARGTRSWGTAVFSADWLRVPAGRRICGVQHLGTHLGPLLPNWLHAPSAGPPSWDQGRPQGRQPLQGGRPECISVAATRPTAAGWPPGWAGRDLTSFIASPSSASGVDGTHAKITGPVGQTGPPDTFVGRLLPPMWPGGS